MRTVWLVRHGLRQDFNEKQEWDRGWPERAKQLGIDPVDAPLTADGIVQAKHAASIIGGYVRHIYSSPFRRCTETAKEIAKVHRAEVSVSTDLTEWMNPEWFKWHYEHLDKIHFQGNRAHFAPGYPIIPESKEEDMIGRWGRVFDGIKTRPVDDFPLVIVSHGGGIHHLLNFYNRAIMHGKGVQFADVYKMEL